LLNLAPYHEDVRVNLHAYLPSKLDVASDKIRKASVVRHESASSTYG